MRTQKHRAFSLIELLVVIAVLAILISIMLPGLSRARAMARRTACAANLSIIGKTMLMYAASENMFPTNPPPKNASKVGKWSNPPSAPGTDDGGDPIIDLYNNLKQPGDPMANLWILVLQRSLVSKQFICPDDPLSPTPAQWRYSTPVWASSGTFLNFGTLDDTPGGGITFSYAFAYPWISPAAIVPNWWKGSPNGSIPIGADIGPSKSPPVDDPTGPVGTPVSNSKNHGGKGQNVLYADAHVLFSTGNDAGRGNDNIYTGDGGNIFVNAGGSRFNVTANLNANQDDVILVPARP